MALAVIGGVGTVLGLVTWIVDRFPAPPPANSMLRVGVGLNDGVVTNAGGLAPDVWAYDALQNQIGRTSDTWLNRPIIDDGTFEDITIFHVADKERAQSQYIFVEADMSGDLICAAYMTLTWADGGRHGWNGDLGKMCGEKWYASNIDIGDGYKPACTWFGYNEPDGVAYGVYANMVAVSPSAGDEARDATYYCSSDVQRYGHTTTSRVRRHQHGQNTRRSVFASQLVVSQIDMHNGTSKELCASPTSYGPSFVSTTENAFCEMETKTLWPICGDSPSEDEICFDLNTYTLLGGKKVVRRSYEAATIISWT